MTMKTDNLIPNYEVYALRYAAHDRPRRDNFIASSDPHDDPMPMDYFVWVIRGNGNVWLVTPVSMQTWRVDVHVIFCDVLLRL